MKKEEKISLFVVLPVGIVGIAILIFALTRDKDSNSLSESSTAGGHTSVKVRGQAETAETTTNDSSSKNSGEIVAGPTEGSDAPSSIIKTIPLEVAEAFRNKVGQDRREEFGRLSEYLFSGTEPYGVKGDDLVLIPRGEFTRFDIHGLLGVHDDASPQVDRIYYYLTPAKDEFLVISWNGMKYQLAVHMKK